MSSSAAVAPATAAKKQQTKKSKLSTPSERPRTRAFAKKHGLIVPDLFKTDGYMNRDLVQEPKKLKPQNRLKVRDNKIAGVSKTSKGSQDQITNLSARKTAKTQRPARPRQSDERTADPVDDLSTETPILAWLQRVTTNHSEEQEILNHSSALQTASTEWDIEIMDSSNFITTNENTTTSKTTGTKDSTVKKDKIPYRRLLEFRGIATKPSSDSSFDRINLEKVGEDAIVQLNEESLYSILSILQKHQTQIKKVIEEGVSDSAFSLYEALREDIEDWTPKTDSHRRFPPISLRHFTIDQEHCLNSGEADFQRTLMISMIDRFDFQNFFTYSCEEQWAMDLNYRLRPLGSPNTISQPKPDLAISFQEDVLRGPELLPYPIQLSGCLHPGKKGGTRWFPFLFIEAKRADHTLEHAQERNLHSASQALFNIYQWMKSEDDLRAKFFDVVRVFTISLNVETIRLRMHRAESSGKDGRLLYHFQELISINSYDRTKACHIIKTVLLDYAKPHLLPILKDAFQRVAQRELDYWNPQKRKQDGTSRNTAESTIGEVEDGKGAAGTEPLSREGSVNTGLSFGAEAIQTSEQPRKRGKVGMR